VTDPGARTDFPRPLTGDFRADGRPLSLEEYVAAGGYGALRKALHDMSPDEVIEETTKANVRGRGGAGFDMGRKWSFVLRGPDAPPVKYVACNADEMEPGSFKDRILMEGNPHLLLEGMLLAGYATEATTGYIFIRGEYARVAKVLDRALDEARDGGYLGERILDSDFAFQIYTHLSAGRYICGEASGMLNALEGKRANPRSRPPHMAGAGLWGRPTVVNNVESLCCAPPVIAKGAEWWLSIRRPEGQEGGSKIYGLSGRVKRPGWWELPLGTPMREVIEQHAGGTRDGYQARAIIPGGASSAFVLAADFDVPLDFASMEKVHSRLGTGTMYLVDDRTCPVALLANLEQFFAQESCGWCTPCREGLPWAYSLLRDIEEGRGEMRDLDELMEIVEANRPERPFCDHSPGAVQPLESGLTYFRGDFEEHIRTGRCRYREGGPAEPGPPGDEWQRLAEEAAP
jgi:NADH-quinone oxidoreductase subunit F